METAETYLDRSPVERELRAALRSLAAYPERKHLVEAQVQTAHHITNAIEAIEQAPQLRLDAVARALGVVRAAWLSFGAHEAAVRYRYKDIANKLKGILLVVQAALNG